MPAKADAQKSRIGRIRAIGSVRPSRPKAWFRTELFDGHNLITSRTYAKHGNRALDDALQLLDVGLHGCRQFLEGTAVDDILIKAVELLVNRLTVYQTMKFAGNSVTVSPFFSLYATQTLSFGRPRSGSILLITTSVRPFTRTA